MLRIDKVQMRPLFFIRIALTIVLAYLGRRIELEVFESIYYLRYFAR